MEPKKCIASHCFGASYGSFDALIRDRWHKTRAVFLSEVLIFFCRVLHDSTPRYVGPFVCHLVGWLVGPIFPFLAFLSFLSLLLLPKFSNDLLQHCSFPTACDWASHVSSLVYPQKITATETGKIQDFKIYENWIWISLRLSHRLYIQMYMGYRANGFHGCQVWLI